MRNQVNKIIKLAGLLILLSLLLAWSYCYAESVADKEIEKQRIYKYNLTWANVAYDEGNWESALSRYQNASSLYPNVSWTNERIAKCKNNLERLYKESIKDVSYDQIMDKLDQYFVMEKGGLIDGQQSYIGKPANKSAILEIIGDKKCITQASIIIFWTNNLAKDMDNTGAAIRFIRNIVPERAQEASDWAADSLAALRDSQERSMEKAFGCKKIEVSRAHQLNAITVMVKIDKKQ